MGCRPCRRAGRHRGKRPDADHEASAEGSGLNLDPLLSDPLIRIPLVRIPLIRIFGRAGQGPARVAPQWIAGPQRIPAYPGVQKWTRCGCHRISGISSTMPSSLVAVRCRPVAVSDEMRWRNSERPSAVPLPKTPRQCPPRSYGALGSCFAQTRCGSVGEGLSVSSICGVVNACRHWGPLWPGWGRISGSAIVQL